MRNAKAFLLPGIGLLGAAMSTAPAMASDSKGGGFALHGIGAQTCQVMLQEIQPPAPPAAATPAAATPTPTTQGTTQPAAGSPPSVAPTLSAAASAAPGSAGAPPAAAPTSAAPAAAAAATPAPAAAAAATPAPAAAAAATPAHAVAAALPSTPPAPVPPTMRPILTSWILGYLTASDRLVKDTFDATPLMAPEALTAMIIGVCQRYPDARVETVANTVLTQLATARVMHESPVVEARDGDHVVPIRKATLVAVQTALVKDKLMKDPADGTFGSSTAAALKQFQKSQNLAQTGLPDSATVVRLLVEMPSKAAAK